MFLRCSDIGKKAIFRQECTIAPVPGKSETPYSYTYRLKSAPEIEPGPQESEVLSSISATLTAMTGGCGSCTHWGDDFCSKHHKRMDEADPRCDQFVRRLPKDGGHVAAEKQIQEYINDILGISDKQRARRLSGIA